VGNRGDRTIRDIKFKKNISTRKKMGVNWEKKEASAVAALFVRVSIYLVRGAHYIYTCPVGHCEEAVTTDEAISCEIAVPFGLAMTPYDFE
jgi:hypothetical protein